MEYESRREALRRRRRNRIIQQLARSAARVLAVFLAGFIAGSLMTGSRLKKEQEVARAQAEAVSSKVPAAEEEDMVQSAPSSWTVAIDPGHGGIDPGSMEAKIDEKDINLDMAMKLRDILEEEGVEVVMTRTGDESLSLADRSDTANEADADVLISIHQNSYDSSSVSGMEFIYNSEKKKGGDESQELAEILEETVLADGGIKVRGIVPNDELKVLRTSDMAAVLVEAGYLTNPSEQRNLLSDSYQEKLMGLLAEGVLEYLEEKC